MQNLGAAQHDEATKHRPSHAKRSSLLRLQTKSKTCVLPRQISFYTLHSLQILRDHPHHIALYNTPFSKTNPFSGRGNRNQTTKCRASKVPPGFSIWNSGKHNLTSAKDHGFLFYCAAFVLTVAGLWKYSDFDEDAKSKKHSKKYRDWAKADAEERKRKKKPARKYTV